MNPDEWIDRHETYLFRFGLLRLQDPRLVEDVVQETFLAALQARDRFAGRSSERTWLVGILKHKIIDHFRKISRENPPVHGDRDGDERKDLFDDTGRWKTEAATSKDWVDDPSWVLERKEFREALARCLSKLPPRMATAFSLRELDDLSSAEVCAALNISAQNLWVILHRARMRLRQCLDGNLWCLRE